MNNVSKYCALKEDYYLGRGYKEKNVSDESYYLLNPWNLLFYHFQFLLFSDNSPKIHFMWIFTFAEERVYIMLLTKFM